MQALTIHAGATALKRLREHGLHAADVRVIPGAAGGPKGLILNPLDRYLFGEWLGRGTQTVHLLGASIGAWRLASACLRDPEAQLARMAEDYIAQDYEHAPGKAPLPRHVSEVFGAKLQEHFAGREAELLQHPRYRLHVFTSRGRHLLRRQGRCAHAAGLHGRVPDQQRQPQGDGAVAGAGDLFRRARAAAAWRCTTTARSRWR